jgi:lysine-N-methylase
LRVLILSEARYRCTTCGDCCRGWDVPLEPGESEKFRRLASAWVPVDQLRIGREKHNNVMVETLAGREGQCQVLTEDQLCRIHGAHGEAAKPRACRIFPYTFVATPSGVRVALSWACPAVIDAEGAPLTEQRAEIEQLFSQAVDGTRYLLRLGDEVALNSRHKLAWRDAELLLGEMASASGNLLEKLCGAGAICVLTQSALDDGKSFEAALNDARAGAPALVKEALAQPISVDRLSRAMFRTLLRTTEPGSTSPLQRLGAVAWSLFGGGKVRLRGGEISLAQIDPVARGLGAGEPLFIRWLENSFFGMTFFGEAAFGLSIASGLDLMTLSMAAAAYLARAYAAVHNRSSVALEDARAAIRQVDAGLSHRSSMPPSFARALEATASLDLLREQL